MFSTFLFLVILSIYIWLCYEPKRRSNQHYHSGSADIAATTPSQTTPRISNTEDSLPGDKLQQNQDKATVQIVDKRTPIPNQSLLVTDGEKTLIQTLESELDADTELEPALTEGEAISLAVETTLANDTMIEVSTGELEDSIPELIRPKPPNSELVEAAVRDAEEKLEDFSPPENTDDASQVRL